MTAGGSGRRGASGRHGAASTADGRAPGRDDRATAPAPARAGSGATGATAPAPGPSPTGASAADAPYTLRGLEAMLGLPRRAIVALVRAGFLTPARGPRNEYRFSFQDVVLLRTAHQLRSARVTPRRMMRSLRRLRERLGDRPLTGLRLQAEGGEVAVHEAGGRWIAASGQRVLDFDAGAAGDPGSRIRAWPRAAGPAAAGAGAVDPAAAAAAAANHATAAAAEPGAAHDDAATAAARFADGERLEATDPAGAEAAYRDALRLAPGEPDAWLNLGALLAEQGRAAEAVALYDEALRHRADDPLLHFNRAIALEDAGRHADAADAYAQCLQRAPDFADAHYNAAGLAERLGRPHEALRHYSAYRRLT